LCPLMLWLDYEGDAQLESFVRNHPEIDMVRRTGNLPLPDFTLAKWLHAVEIRPTITSDVCAVMGAKDYVRTRLCGGAFVTDWNEASGTQFYDPFNRSWASDLLAAAQLPIGALPGVVDSTASAPLARGRTGASLAEHSIVGSGDQAAASRAVGALRKASSRSALAPPGWSLLGSTSGTSPVAGTVGSTCSR
jgi:sugar (pentulose or hexulose) kinase